MLRIFTKLNPKYRKSEQDLIGKIETVVKENIGSIANVQNDKLYINEDALDKFSPTNQDLQQNISRELNNTTINNEGEEEYTVEGQLFKPTPRAPRRASQQPVQSIGATAYLSNYPNYNPEPRPNDPFDDLMHTGTVPTQPFGAREPATQGGDKITNEDIIKMLSTIQKQQEDISYRLGVIENTMGYGIPGQPIPAPTNGRGQL